MIDFIDDTIKEGLNVILYTDANQNVAIGKWSRQLRERGLVESLSIVTGEIDTAAHIRGSNKIDAVWVTSVLDARAASLCAFNFSAEDHRAFIVDIDVASILGDEHVTICTPETRKLTSSNVIAVQKNLAATHKKLQF